VTDERLTTLKINEFSKRIMVTTNMWAVYFLTSHFTPIIEKALSQVVNLTSAIHP
jgi:hypothetical protein